jgi:guanine deaminase
VPSVAPSTYADRQLPLATLLHLATLGGAQVCGLEDRIGSFAPGKSFDALVVSVHGDAGNLGLWGADIDRELRVELSRSKEIEVWLERFLFTGDDRNIKRVYVQGRWIGGAERVSYSSGRNGLVN